MAHSGTVMLPMEATHDYHFVTIWCVRATREEVYRILEATDQLTEWWPAVYLKVRTLEKGQTDGVGKRVELHTKGWLPYTLRWQFEVTQTKFPEGFSLRAMGDFAGTGVWRFEQEGDQCVITYDWRIAAEKPLLRRMSWLLRGVFSANHEWAMRKGLKSLELALRRYRGEAQVPRPPGPTFPHNIGWRK